MHMVVTIAVHGLVSAHGWPIIEPVGKCREPFSSVYGVRKGKSDFHLRQYEVLSVNLLRLPVTLIQYATQQLDCRSVRI